MGLQELIDKHYEELGGDVESIALALYDEVIEDADLVYDIIIPALKQSVSNRLRHLTRLAEEESMLSGRPTANPTAERLAFLADKFFVPGYGMVSWGEATIEQHQLRIEYLNKKMNGLLDTITRHDKAIAEIEEAGVKTLGDIHGPRKRRRRSPKTAAKV